jgi:phosphate starvation-inducible PhoH-like protein
MLKKKTEESEQKLNFEDIHLVKLLVGEHDAHLKFIEKTLEIKIHVRGNPFSIVGEEEKVHLAGRLSKPDCK